MSYENLYVIFKLLGELLLKYFNRKHVYSYLQVNTIISLLLFTFACEKGTYSVQSFGPDNNQRSECSSCNILFIGSSYLSFIGNDVVATFSQFAEQGGKDAYIEMRSIGGWHLDDHSQDENTIAKINERQWDYIILQGNSAYLSKKKWHHYIVPYIKDLRKIIKDKSPRTCVIYMMPWAYTDGLVWLPDETETYEQMQDSLFHYTTELG